jgi:hypothetical protein
MKTLLKISLIVLCLMTPVSTFAQSSASLDRLVSQIESMFPPLEGYVVAVDGSGLTLDLKQGMAVKSGDRLKLIRYGRELFHPVTKKKIGRKETDLGEVEIIEVRKNFSLAQALDPTVLPKEGDGVQSAFQKLSFLVAPPQIKTKKKVNADRLRFNLESRLNKHPRFLVPSFDLGLWMAEGKLNIKSTLKPNNLKKLDRKVQADFILVPSVRTLKGKMALNYKLISAADGLLKKQANIMSDNLPTSDSPRERSRGTQTSFNKKEDVFKFIGKQEYPYQIIDMEVGDLNGDGKDEVILIDRYRITAYANKKGTLRKIAQIKTNKVANHFLTIDVADINRNGRDEIFITNQVGSKLKSFVLETRPKKKGFKYIMKDVNLHFSILRPMGKRPFLISQNPGFQDPFHGPIYEMSFKNGKYIQGPQLNTPDIYGTQFILYGFTQEDLNGNGKLETIVLDKNYHLRVYSENGRTIVKSNDYYGHDPRLIDVGVREDIDVGTQLGEEVRYRGKLNFVEMGADRFLVLPLNKPHGDGFLNRLIIIQGSGLALLRVTGEGFEKAFESSKQKGFLGAYKIIPNKKNSEALVYILRIDKDFVTKKTFSTISTYKWSAQ